MTPTPTLDVAPPAGPPTAVVLVLHGGRSTSEVPTRVNQLAVLRMLPFAWALRRAGGADGLVVARLRYAVRGWNGAERSPLHDAEWALDQLARRFPNLPSALVGHSMGGRTALYAAGYPGVQAVVGLAPWLEPGDPIAQLAGRRLLIAHGTADRMTSPAASTAYALAAARVAESVSYVSVTGEKHAMLRRARTWQALTAGFVTGVLYGRSPDGSDDGLITKTLVNALAGQPSLVV